MVVVGCIIGLFIGSFLNVLVIRMPKNEDVVTSRSRCDHCGRRLSWYMLIPLFSYIIQGGKSRCCGKPLSIQYPISELACGLGFAAITGGFFGPGSVADPVIITRYVAALVVFSSLFVLFLTDLREEIILMEMIFVCAAAALVVVILEPISSGVPLTWQWMIGYLQSGVFLGHILSAGATGLFFFCLWFFSRGKAMGDGDMYLSAVLAFLIGYPDVVVYLYAAFLTGAILGAILILVRKTTLKTHIPFGPFLIWGYVVALLWGQRILELWRTIV